MAMDDEALGKIASRLWDERLHLEFNLIEGDPHGVVLSSGETMKARDTTIATLPSGVAIHMTGTWDGFPGIEEIKIVDGDDAATFHGRTPISRAWEAVQCAAMIEALGGDVPRVRGVFPLPKRRTLLQRLLRKPTPFDTLMHVRSDMMRLVEEAGRRCGTMEEDGTCGIGGEMRLHAAYDPSHYGRAYEAWVHHPRIGTVHIGFRQAKDIMDAIRDRVLHRMASTDDVERFGPLHQGSRSSEMLRIGRLALAIHPDLVDPGGARIDDLVQVHVPDLLTKHRKASRDADEDRRVRNDEELEKGLDVAIAALELAVATKASQLDDDLLTQVRFLRMRHPDAASAS